MTLVAEMAYRHIGETPVCAGHDHGSASPRDRSMAAAVGFLLLLLLLPFGAGCQKELAKAAEPVPVVPISRKFYGDPVADSNADFTGRTRYGPIGEHRRSGDDQLPGADALRGRGGSQEGENCCSRSTANPAKRVPFRARRWRPTNLNCSSAKKNFESGPDPVQAKRYQPARVRPEQVGAGSGDRSARRWSG